jgi:hypothetical protein
MVWVGVVKLEVEASLHIFEGGTGVGESGQDVVDRRVVVPRPPPARIRRRHPRFGPVRRATPNFESEARGV